MQQGREWELLVAQLETLFAAPGFHVRSPENIRGRAGNVVKVDVTVRGRVAGQEVLIAFECRDRGKRAGVDWVQQAVGRQQSVGASAWVLVSREPFTKDAKLESAYHGITLRHLERLDLEAVADMLLGLRLEVLRARYRATQVDFSRLRVRPFGLDAFGPWPKFTPEHLQEILNHPLEPRFIDRLSDTPVSVNDLVHQADWASAFGAGHFEDRRAHVAPLFADFRDRHGEPGRLLHWMDTGHGVIVDRVSFLGEVWWEPEPVKLSSVARYSSDEGVLATIAEFDLAPHGITEVLQVFIGGS